MILGEVKQPCNRSNRSIAGVVVGIGVRTVKRAHVHVSLVESVQRERTFDRELDKRFMTLIIF